MILHELYRHARETFPEECCGLIIGDSKQRFGRVLSCRNEMTRLHTADPKKFPRDNHRAFYMNPADLKEAEEQVERSGENIVAIYHSHVGADVYLSEIDVEYIEDERFPYREAAQIVVAVLDQQVNGAGIFERVGIDKPFRGQKLEAAGP